MGRVLKTEFAVNRRRVFDNSETLSQDLRHWKQQIPPELALCQVDSTLGAPFWARMLYSSYEYVAKCVTNRIDANWHLEIVKFSSIDLGALASNLRLRQKGTHPQELPLMR